MSITKHLGQGDSFASFIDLLQNELRNARIQNLASAPGTPVEGQIYYDTVLHEFRFYNGTAWENCDGSTIALLLAGGTMSGAIAMGTHKITGLGAPTATGDAATWDYVNSETTRAETAEGLLAPLANPALTGSPTAPTKAALTNNTDIATTAYTDSAVGVETGRAETAEGLLAPKANPTFTGVPLAPTAAPLTDDTQIATTAYADTAVGVELSRAETAEGLLLPKAGGTFTGNLQSNGTAKVTGLPAPSSSSDAATKAYVDSAITGLDPKPSVTATATVALSAAPATGGLQNVDGVALAAGQRVLATAQATPSQNGLWVVAVGAWTRPTDFATGSAQAGVFVLTEQGTANAGAGFILTGSGITVDTNSETWVQFSKTTVGVLNKYATSIGNSASTSFTVTHNLNTTDVVVSFMDSSGNSVFVDWTAATVNTITVVFETAPLSGAQIRVVVIG